MGVPKNKEQSGSNPGTNPETTPKPVDESEALPDLSKEAGTPTETPTSEHQQAQMSAEVAAPPPGKLHKSFFERTQKFDENTVEEFRTTLRNSTIEDIRYGYSLLNKEATTNKVSVKEETARRIRAYTSMQSGEWYTIDYQTMGLDKNYLDHETFIGLGDILLDPDIKNLAVIKNGQKILATRGIVGSGQHQGRVGFVDTYGDYVATYTNDQFKILSDEEMAEEQYRENLAQEMAAREKGKESFLAEIAPPVGEYAETPEIDSASEPLPSGKEGEMTGEIARRATNECTGKHTAIEKTPEKRPNTLKVFNYVGQVVDLPPELLIAIAKNESGFRYTVGDGGKSIGMMQLRKNKLKTPREKELYRKIIGQPYEAPGSLKLGESVLADVLIAALVLKRASNKFGFDIHYGTDLTNDKPDELDMTRAEWLRMYYKLPSPAGSFAKWKRGIKGHPTKRALSYLRRHRIKQTRKGPVDRFDRYLQNVIKARRVLGRRQVTATREKIKETPSNIPFPLGGNDLIYSLGAQTDKTNQARAWMVLSLAKGYYPNAKLGFSGGVTEEGKPSEAQEQINVVKANGIDNRIVIKDEKAEDTYGNMDALVDYVQSLPQNKRPKRILLVSSKKRHAKRAIKTLRKVLKKRKISNLGVEISYYTPDSRAIDSNVKKV